MTLRPALLFALLACGCQQAPRSQADRATQVQCRAEVDRVYAAQNRAELSRRDERDTPFAGNYLSGVTTRDLGAKFGRDNEFSSCVARNRGGSATDTSPGTTFSPVAP